MMGNKSFILEIEGVIGVHYILCNKAYEYESSVDSDGGEGSHSKEQIIGKLFFIAV